MAQTAYGAYVTKNFVPGGGAGTGWFELMNNNATGQLQFRVTGDTADVSLNSATTLALNTWYDVVATYDGATAKMYVNGALDSSLALTATPAQTSDPLYIGRRSDGSYNNALIDEVAVYPSALSAAQVARHWQAGGYVPGAPTGVSAVRGTANKATVSWTAPSYAGASAISGYTVLTTGGPTQIAPFAATASPATIVGLSGGQSYTFTVTAKNSFGSGAASSASGAVIPTGNAVPTVPTTVAATAGNLQATVSWHAPTSNGGSSITGYTVTPYVGTTAGTPQSVSANTLSTTMTSLLNGTTYTFQIYATNAVGPGPAATTSAVTPAAVPGAPTNVLATAGNAQATVSWSAPSNGGSTITNYAVPLVRFGTVAGDAVAGVVGPATVPTYGVRVYPVMLAPPLFGAVAHNPSRDRRLLPPHRRRPSRT